jgi:hypothetical protein
MTDVVIWTDGSSTGKSLGPGGYAAIVITDGQEQVLGGGDTLTNHQRMELMAPVVGGGTARDGAGASPPQNQESYERLGARSSSLMSASSLIRGRQQGDSRSAPLGLKLA